MTSPPLDHVPPPAQLAKLWYLSKTIYSGLGSIGAGVAGVYLAWTGDRSPEALGAALTAIFSGAGAIYYRIKATQPISDKVLP